MRPDPQSPAHRLATHFAQRAVTWAREHDAPGETLDTLREAAYRASLATASGHVCVMLDEVEWPGNHEPPAVRRQLVATRVVGTPADARNHPLIVDDSRLYLHRYFDYEQRLARCLMSRAAAPVDVVPHELRTHLDVLFARNAAALGERTDWQRIAVALAMLRRLAIVSGGPGTGKTTAVVSLLACLLMQNPDCRIALAAPTGKAAARMLDAIRVRTDGVPPDVAARFPTEAFTVHRLLGVASDGRRFRHHAGHPLPVDVLVVDEASMLDLALATHLFEAVPAQARAILLGDKDQLAAVEAGAVFAEISADPWIDPAMRGSLAEMTGTPVARVVAPVGAPSTPLANCVVWLTESYRFRRDSGIGRLAALINAGDADAAIDALRESDSSIEWIGDDARTPQPATMRRAEEGYRAYAAAVREGATDRIFPAFDRFRVLCAERGGARGVAGMNDALTRWFRAALDHPLDPGPRSAWYPGRPVIVMRNDYALRLFNGDVGIVLPDAAGQLFAFFPEAGGFRAIPPARLPEHDTAFSMTVHKAQGSEFDEVMLMLPSKASRVVTRELLYTGVTRARCRVVIASAAEVLAQGVVSRTSRRSGLVDRMREAVAD